MKFLRANLGRYTVLHGYDDEMCEVLEEVEADGFTEALIHVDRIVSINPHVITLVDGDELTKYWEYEEDFEVLSKRLEAAGLVG